MNWNRLPLFGLALCLTAIYFLLTPLLLPAKVIYFIAVACMSFIIFMLSLFLAAYLLSLLNDFLND